MSKALLALPGRVAAAITRHAWTLFLFTKSDIKTTLIPITGLAIASSPDVDPSHISHTIFWVWLHLLQFDVSNQTLDPEEDEENKRDRPLPSGRMTLRDALVLRWVLIPTCFALSYAYSLYTLYASVALVALTVIYDELGAHSGHFITRNVVNALGFASFEVGATLVTSRNREYLDLVAILSVCISSGIFATTIQAQDMKDVEGDAKIGRQTLPIVWPSIARHTVFWGLLLWSLGLTYVWQLDWATAFVFVTLALVVGYRYLAFKTVSEDQVSFYLYNVWLTFAHVLPGYYRLYHA